MRTFFFILLFIPLFTLAQKTEVLIKLIDARGLQIKGDAVLKGYEKWIGATTMNSGGKNNTQLSFTMAVSGASADLKRAMLNNELLINGQVTVLASNQTTYVPSVSYTIKMEQISVLSCSETMGCNNVMNTTVILQATRIGWTYYTTTGGTQTISRKFGWDTSTGKEWTNF